MPFPRFLVPVTLVGLVAVGTLGGVASAAAVSPSPTDLAPAKAIVAYEGDLPAGILGELVELGIERAIELPTIDAVAVTGPASVIQSLADDPGVRAVQPQRRIALDLYASVEQIGARGVDEPATYTTSDDGREVERPGVTGDGTTVAVIDTGVFAAHPDLLGRVTTGANFELSGIQDAAGIPYEQWELYAEATAPLALVDEVGHGTHVAGTIAGDGTAAVNHDDMSGVAPAAEVVSLRIASAPNGVVEDFDFEENALAAMDYLVRNGADLGVTVANNSWSLLPYEPGANGIEGFPTDYDAAAEMTRAVVDAGITMVFSAGNDGPDPDTIRPSPAGIEEVVTVAAACKAIDGACEPGGITDFSSRGPADGSGPQVDVSAPGDTILAAAAPSVLVALTRCPEALDPAYICLSGTSMAAPHVAGVVALMQEVSPGITPAEVEACLVATATDMLEPEFDIHSGAGMVDTPAALACAHERTLAAVPGDDDVDGAPDRDDDADDGGRPLPVTGGGLAVAGLVGLVAAGALRRR